jgi:hypothetical protein
MPSTFNTTVPFTIEVSVTVNDTVTLYFNGDPDGPISMVDLPADNAGTVVSTITAVTATGTPYTQAITMTGEDANKFRLTNGGIPPCDLVIATPDLPEGTHTGSLTFKAPKP